MKIGDLVHCWPHGTPDVSAMKKGVIVGFNEKGEGGKDFVHVLIDGSVQIFMEFNIEVVK